MPNLCSLDIFCKVEMWCGSVVEPVLGVCEVLRSIPASKKSKEMLHLETPSHVIIF